MLPSEEFGLVPKFGIEIEVPAWTDGTKSSEVIRQGICLDLIKGKHMSKVAKYESAFHRYHCDCSYCMKWLKGKIPWPVQTILQYDASLPDSGGEFITSPMLCTGLFLDNLKEIWDTVVKTARWTRELPNRRGGHSSPSVHIHVSVDNPYKDRLDPHMGREAIWGYMPELFMLAATAGTKRGTEFCSPSPEAGHHSALNIVNVQPTRVRVDQGIFDDDPPPIRFDLENNAAATGLGAMFRQEFGPEGEIPEVAPAPGEQAPIWMADTGHPGHPPTGMLWVINQFGDRFLWREGGPLPRRRLTGVEGPPGEPTLPRNVRLREARPGRPREPQGSALRYEWRMWEANYKNWQYTKGAIVISCALTQLLSNRESAELLRTAGVMLPKPFDYEAIVTYNTDEVLKFFSRKRFDFLRDNILSAPLVTEDREVYVAAQDFMALVPKG